MATKYPRERLADAVASSHTMSEVLRRLGGESGPSTRKYVRERIRLFGIDTSHLTREGGRWTREVLAEAVAASASMYDVLRYLSVDVVGGQHTHISRRVRDFGIDTSHFGKGGPHRARAEDRPPGSVRRARPEQLRRVVLASGAPERCASCGLGPSWRHRVLPLEVDHIDGGWRNNAPENLRLLCPNCHSATDTYRGRGKRVRTTATSARAREGGTR